MLSDCSVSEDDLEPFPDRLHALVHKSLYAVLCCAVTLIYLNLDDLRIRGQETAPHTGEYSTCIIISHGAELFLLFVSSAQIILHSY